MPCPPFASSATRFLSVHPGCFCVDFVLVGFFRSLWCLVVEVGLGWGGGCGGIRWGEGSGYGYLGSFPNFRLR